MAAQIHNINISDFDIEEIKQMKLFYRLCKWNV